MDIVKKLIIKIISAEARWALRRWRARVVGITGSVGKSSAKEAIAMVLESRFRVRKSNKSYNSEIGLSLAVLGRTTAWRSWSGWICNIAQGLQEVHTKHPPEILVLEMGVDRPQDMDRLLGIVRPDIAVITAIGELPVHVEFFPDAEDIAREKSKLARQLAASGWAVLNADDPIVHTMKEKTNASILTYGFSDSADLVASNYKISEDGIALKVDYKGASVPVRLHEVYGKQQAYAALATIAVVTLFDMNLVEAAQALQRYKPLPGRLRHIEGIKNSFILDDTYNASPLATAAAFDVLQELPAKRKIVVFGDMLELGKYAIEAHQKVGTLAKFADYLITVGPRAKFAAESAVASGMTQKNVLWFATAQEVASFLKECTKENDMILIKGSQSMRMERVVEEIMAHPEQASELLCRQDDYWKNKK